LQAAIAAEFGFSMPFTVAAREKPDFELIQCVDNTTIYVSAAPNVMLTRSSRDNIDQDILIGIGVLKKLKMDETGNPNQAEFRELKSLMQALFIWSHVGISGYTGKAKNVAIPAWYDLSKAITGSFLSVVTMVYQTKFSP